MNRQHRRRQPRTMTATTVTIQPGSVITIGTVGMTVERLLRHKTGGAIVTFTCPDSHLINIGYLMSDHQTLLMCTDKFGASDIFDTFATASEQAIINRLIASGAVPLAMVLP